MITFDSNQRAVVNDIKSFKWLFEVDKGDTGTVDYYWSTESCSYGGNSYSFKIINFKGITMQRSLTEYGMFAPNKITLDVSNKDSALSPSDFSSGSVSIKLVATNSSGTEQLLREWSFSIKKVESVYQRLIFHLESWVDKYLDGDYPNTPLLSYIFPSEDSIQDNACVPVVIGEPYIPIRSVYITDQRYYVLGRYNSSYSYSISKIRTPTQWEGVMVDWVTSGTQTHKTGNDGNEYQVVQFEVVDSDGDGVADKNILFQEGNHFLDVPCKYSYSETSSLTNPANFIKYVLEDMGIPESKLNLSSFSSAETIYSNRGITFNGGYWYRRSRKEVLSELLCMADAELIVRDQIYLRVHDNSVVDWSGDGAKIDSSVVLQDSFTTSLIDSPQEDSGYIDVAISDVPISNLLKIVVPSYGSGTTNRPTGGELNFAFYDDNQDAQKTGILAYSRKLLKEWQVRFKAKAKTLALEPDDMIEINDALYGGNYRALIDRITITNELEVEILATKFSRNLESWNDLLPSAVTPATDNSTGTYNIVTCGPNSPGTLPNYLPGLLKIGNETNSIELQPSEPWIRVVEGTDVKVVVGNLTNVDDTDLNPTGYGLYTDNVFLKGKIIADSGTIGGWDIGTDSLSKGTSIILHSTDKYISINDATFGNAGIQLQYNSGHPQFYVGDGSSKYFRYRYDGGENKLSWKGVNTELTESGQLSVSDILATGGSIGGWNITATKLSSANIELDSGNNRIKVNTITIDGAVTSTRIRSDNYTSGVNGAGFTLEPDLLEVGNIRARGAIRTAVFQKDTVSCVGGNLAVLSADVLAEDMTALDSCHLTIEGNETFAVNDILRIKDGVNDEWFEVTDASNAPEYVVTRDKAGQYEADANPTWKRGASVINYGQSGDGFVYITSSEENAPYLSVHTHTGSPWTGLNTWLRVGNLNGFLGYTTDEYGIAIGETDSHLKYDPTNHLRIRGDITVTGSNQTWNEVIDEYTRELFHFDSSLLSTTGLEPYDYENTTKEDYGLVHGTNLVATLRKDGWRGGAVGIEEATENLITDTDYSDWTAYSGASVTVTQGQEDPFGGSNGTRIQTSGGSDILKYFYDLGTGEDGQDYSYQTWVKVLSGSLVVRSKKTPSGETTYIPADGWQKWTASNVGDGVAIVQLQFKAEDASDSLDFLAYQPQIEKKAFPTSFVDGSRDAGRLKYPYTLTKQGTFSCRICLDQDVSDIDTPHMFFDTHGYDLRVILYIYLNALRLYIKNGDTSIIDVSSWKAGEWHTVACSWDFDNNQWLLQADDTFDTDSTAKDWGTPGEYCHIGTNYVNGEIANALIDEVRIDSVARTQEELLAWHNSNAPFLDPNAFGNKEGTVVIDHSGITITDSTGSTAISSGKIVLDGGALSGILSVSHTEADVTADNPQDLDWIIGTSGSLGITAGGKLLLEGNWTTTTGMQLDSESETLRFGGSNVDAAGSATGIFLGKDSSSYKAFIGESNSYLKYDPTNHLRIKGAITVTNPADVRNDINVADGADVTQTAIDGGIVTTGYLRSNNWASSAGTQISLNDETLKFGGSGVTADGAQAGIFLGKDSGEYKAFMGSPTSYMRYNPTDGLKVLGNIVNLQMFAVSNWIERDSSFGTTFISAVAHNGTDLWVAVGLDGKLATSPDGINWTQRTSSFGTTHISNVAHNGTDLWVAVGWDGKLATSPDGINWTQRSTPFGTGEPLYAVAHNGTDLWVVAGWEGILATSPDGINWTQRTSSFGSTTIRDVAHNGTDLWVAVGLDGKLATSPDGINWTQRTSSFGTTNIRTVTYNGKDLWVAGGDSGKIATSPDGINWTQRESSLGSDVIGAIAYNGKDLWVAGGDSGKIATSPDGINWTQRIVTLSSHFTQDIAYGNAGLWVAVSSYGELATSLVWTGE